MLVRACPSLLTYVADVVSLTAVLLSVCRFTDSTQVYVMQNGVLRGIPNLHTFIAMGYDFDNVKALYASDRPGYSIGAMLPQL